MSATTLNGGEWVLVVISPLIAYAAIQSPGCRKLGWAGLMLFLSMWAMYDAVKSCAAIRK